MAAVQTMTIPQFLSGSYREETQQLINKLTSHLKQPFLSSFQEPLQPHL
jgi:hypothetical protein